MFYELILTHLGHQWARKLALLIFAFSFTVFVYNASHLFYHLKYPMVAPVDFGIESLDLTHFKAKQANNLELFGHYEAHAEGQKFIPVSDLDVALVSIMYSPDDDEQSLALIKKNNEQATLFHLHDELFPGIVVDKILNDRVIVNNNGKLEMIKLPEEQIDFTLVPVRG